MKSRRKSRKWLWIAAGALLVLLVVGGYVVFSRLQELQQSMAQGTTGDIATAFMGDLATGATASGQVLAQRDASLALSSAGIVAEVLVEAGDAVKEGDSLVVLDTAGLERAVESARQALLQQEANLAAIRAPASALDLAAAQAAVSSAQAALDDLLDGPSADEIATAEANLRASEADLSAAYARLSSATGSASEDDIRAAEIELELAQKDATLAAERHRTILVTEPNRWLSENRLEEIELAVRAAAVQANAALAAAQEALDRLRNGDPYAVASAQAGVALAEAQRDSAQAQLDLLLQGASAAQIASAKASLAQAQANPDRLLRGPSQSQIALAEIGVEQARISLQRAENDLADATLVAPFDGTVTAVHTAPGEVASGILVEMVDTASLEVVLEVDEVDIAEVAAGVPAIITLETWPEVEIEGQVASIAPRSTSGNGGIVSYRVYLSFDQARLPVRVGMTANADLVTSNRQGVLLLPNRAISVDRSAGTYGVNQLVTDANGMQSTKQVSVTVGLRDDSYTQITGGLQEGDQVVIGDVSAVLTFHPPGQGQQGGGPFAPQ